MKPILFTIGSLEIYSYGVFIALGYIVALSISAFYLGKKEQIAPEKITDLFFLSLICGFVGARILFVITRYEHFLNNPVQVFYFWKGGFVFFGGFLAALAFVVWFCRKQKLSLLKVFDIGAIALLIGHGFGRIGCFMAGCCHGAECDLPWAVTLDSLHVEDSLRGIPIHPTQIYEAIFLLGFAAVLLKLWPKRKFLGQFGMIYLSTYSAWRIFIETLRGDTVRGYVIDGWLTTSQFISIFLVVAGIAGYKYLSKQRA